LEAMPGSMKAQTTMNAINANAKTSC
jgi:hypothetical protein